MAPTDPAQWGVPQWTLERFLGTGAYGPTFVAKNVQTDERCVLKVYSLSPDALRDMKDKQLQLEDVIRTEAMAKLKTGTPPEGVVLPYPGVWPAMDLSHNRETRAIALPQLDTTFEDELVKGKYVQLTDYLPIVAGVLDTLSAVHARGVTHNDIKPSNIGFLHGDVKLFDFGIASSMDREHCPLYRHAGSIKVMAPETVGTNGKLTPASDLYQIGVMLYYLETRRLTGTGRHPCLPEHYPKKEETEARLMFEAQWPAHVHATMPGEIMALRELGSPPLLVDIIEKLLNPDSNKRYHEAEKVVDALGRTSNSGHFETSREKFVDDARMIDKLDNDIRDLRKKIPGAWRYSAYDPQHRYLRIGVGLPATIIADMLPMHVRTPDVNLCVHAAPNPSSPLHEASLDKPVPDTSWVYIVTTNPYVSEYTYSFGHRRGMDRILRFIDSCHAAVELKPLYERVRRKDATLFADALAHVAVDDRPTLEHIASGHAGFYAVTVPRKRPGMRFAQAIMTTFVKDHDTTKVPLFFSSPQGNIGNGRSILEVIDLQSYLQEYGEEGARSFAILTDDSPEANASAERIAASIETYDPQK